MDATFLQEQIDYWTALILVYQTALTALSTGTLKSYTLSTGQTTQTVTKKDTFRLTETLNEAYRMLDYFDIRLNGGVTLQVRPG
jgi:hypothetical protein